MNDFEGNNLPKNSDPQPDAGQNDSPPPADDLSNRENGDGFSVLDTGETPQFDFSARPTETELSDLGFTPLSIGDTSPTRRRRGRRPVVARPAEDEIADRLENLARRATPTFDYFVFSIVAGALLGAGYLLDSPAILFFGILAAPLLTPWIGAALALAVGEARYLGQTLGGLFTSLLIILLIGMLAGLASRLFLPLTFSEAHRHASLWWPDLLLLAVGAVIFVITFIQSEEKPVLPGLMLSYALYLPISAAGFGIGNGVEGIFPQALLIFLVHLALALLLALAVFYYMRFRPIEPSGYIWGAGAIVVSLVLIGGIAGLGTVLARQAAASAQAALVTPPATVSLPTLTPKISLALATSTPPAPTVLAATSTPKATITTMPTPAYGKIQSRGDGAVIRQTPDGPAITTIQNGYLVEILPDAPVTTASGTIWIHVRVNTTTQIIEGWVQLNLVITPTP
ncbi:DUF389 domain-containing protein [bacterium]|nr:DUF389 domain-containing protein [bacterium]NCT21067.1 DUF389 domain-containing protein [bacterium]OIO87463.1 MAG: hypothetical protein AUK01_00120 [Anaerolineae bacterium CG2_30_57_67]